MGIMALRTRCAYIIISKPTNNSEYHLDHGTQVGTYSHRFVWRRSVPRDDIRTIRRRGLRSCAARVAACVRTLCRCHCTEQPRRLCLRKHLLGVLYDRTGGRSSSRKVCRRGGVWERNLCRGARVPERGPLANASDCCGRAEVRADSSCP